MTTKVCSKCKVEKGRDEFHRNKTTCDGLTEYCMQCRKALDAKRYANNREKVKVACAKWRANNSGYCAQWRANNPEKVKVARAKWCANNPEKVKGKDARWRANNPEKVKEKNDRYLATIQDSYVKNLLGTPNPPQELIELKRLQLQLIREIKQQGK